MVGMADNGDFVRVTRAAGLAHTAEFESFRSKYVRPEFRHTVADWGSFISSTTLWVWVAKAFDQCVRPGDGYFRLASLGFTYWLLLAAGAAWFATAAIRASPKSRVLPFLVATLFLWILSDPNYLLFFNSFYCEALLWPLLVALLAGLLVGGEQPSPRLGAALVALGLLAACTKKPYMLVPGLLGISLLPWWWKASKGRPRTVSATTILLLVAAMLAAGGFFHRRNDLLDFLRRINNFNAVFSGIVEVSSRPEEVLESLGIPTEYGALRGKSFYDLDDGEYTPELAERLRRLSRLQLLGLYLRDPAALRRATAGAGKALSLSRLRYPGHFEEAAGRGKAEYVVPWQFSTPRDALFRGVPGLCWIVMLVATFRSVRALRRGWNGWSAVECFLLLNLVSQVFVSILGDGLFGMGRHLVFGRCCMDLLLILQLCGIGRASVEWLQPRVNPGS